MTSPSAASVTCAIESLVAVHDKEFPDTDPVLLRRAYDVAEQRHRGERRRTGDPYITHPLAVATILAELGMDTATVAAGLLHDAVRESDCTLSRIRAEFGDTVARLVDQVHRMSWTSQMLALAGTERTVITLARDPRALVIQLADRLHNIRTIHMFPPEKQERKALEILQVLAPIAGELGLFTVQRELEDLAFAVLYPPSYDEIVRLVAARAPARVAYLQQVKAEITAHLTAAHVKAEIQSRPKHYYSIYQKMTRQGTEFDDVLDLVGVRITVDDVRNCYGVLGAVHALWPPIPGQFEDFIAQPRFGNYQSLHTAVLGPDGKPLEVQIRTHQIDRRIEYRTANTWPTGVSADVLLTSMRRLFGPAAADGAG
jgi:GTP pyrophosphokinase